MRLLRTIEPLKPRPELHNQAVPDGGRREFCQPGGVIVVHTQEGLV